MPDPTAIPSCSACSEPIPSPAERWPAATTGTVCQTCWEAQSSRLWWAMVRLLPEERAPLGRKRRARRARGRKIKARRPYSSAALAMAAAFKADAKRAAAFRPFAERLAADFARQAEALLHQRP